MRTAADYEREAADGRPLGILHTWWHGDALPAVNPPDGFSVDERTPHAVLAEMAGLSVDEVLTRIERSNRPYVALVRGEPVAYGWSAAGPAEIDTILRFQVPRGDRYLWDFVTLPAWRGRDIYPALLQEIIKRESRAAKRFWVGHDEGNEQSRIGIRKAGFRRAGEMRILPDNRLAFIPGCDADRSEAGAMVLGLPLLHQESRVNSRCA